MGKYKHAAHGAGSVYRINDKRRTRPWVASVTDASGKRRLSYHQSQQEAERARREMLYQVEHQTLAVESHRETVAAYLERWLETKKMALKVGSYAYYHDHTHRYIIPAIGHLKLQRLSPEDIEKMYADLVKRIAPSTVKLTHRVLCAALGDAVRRRRLASNPATLVTLPRQKSREMTFLTVEQVQHLLAVAAGHPLECLLTLALTTGMRQGELLALRWSDVDFVKKTVHVARSRSYKGATGDGYKLREEEPKTSASRRVIPLAEVALAALKSHRIQQIEARLKMPGWRNTDLIFTSDEGGHAWPETVREQFRSLLAQAELPPIRFHDLRHACATTLISLGVNPRTVMEWLGHSSITVTLNTYSHVSEGLKAEARDKLNTLFQEASS